VRGTELFVMMTLEENDSAFVGAIEWQDSRVTAGMLEATVRDIDLTRVRFTLPGIWANDDITRREFELYISRGEEALTDVQEHLRHAKKVLCKDPRLQPNAFVCTVFGIPLEEKTLARLSSAMELKMASKHQRIPSGWKRLNFVRHQRRYTRKRDAAIRDIKEDLESPNFKRLNQQQLESVSRDDNVSIIQGYPGSAKTSTLVAGVLQRFQQLLQRRRGWILITVNTNPSALSVLEKLMQFPSLRPFIHFGYSKMYAAYHEADFKDAYDYRITPKDAQMKADPHGILLVTVGSLSRVLKKFGQLSEVIFDVFVDEAGQLFHLDVMLIMAWLPNVVRMRVFGDVYQLPPYVTKLLKEDVVQPSLMRVLLHCLFSGDSPLTASKIRLQWQYRMTAKLCRLHTGVFYGAQARISTFRQASPNPKWDGYWLLRVPTGRGDEMRRGVQSYVQRSVKAALDAFLEVHSKNLRAEDGQLYTFAILTPYRAVMDALMHAWNERKEDQMLDISVDPVISTIDRVQGCEWNCVIVVTARERCNDLNRSEYRANVATSRARDIVILLCSDEFAESKKSRGGVRCWGQLVAGSRLYHENDTQAALLRANVKRLAAIDMKALQRNPPPGHIRVTRVMQYARELFYTAPGYLDKMCADTTERQNACKRLFLKDQYWNISAVMKPMFGAMMECSTRDFRRVIEIFATESHNGTRNDMARETLGLSRSSIVTPEVDEMIRTLYAVHVKPVSRSRPRKRK